MQPTEHLKVGHRQHRMFVVKFYTQQSSSAGSQRNQCELTVSIEPLPVGDKKIINQLTDYLDKLKA